MLQQKKGSFTAGFMFSEAQQEGKRVRRARVDVYPLCTLGEMGFTKQHQHNHGGGCK